jgi:hypothetical protein
VPVGANARECEISVQMETTAARVESGSLNSPHSLAAFRHMTAEKPCTRGAQLPDPPGFVGAAAFHEMARCGGTDRGQGPGASARPHIEMASRQRQDNIRPLNASAMIRGQGFLMTTPPCPPTLSIRIKCCRKRKAVSLVRIGKFCCTSRRSCPPKG